MTEAVDARGRLVLRWLAGTREADGHVPDTYGYDALELIELTSSYAAGPAFHAPRLSSF